MIFKGFMSVKFRTAEKTVSGDDKVMAWRSSVQSSSELSDIQEMAVDDIVSFTPDFMKKSKTFF